MTPIATKKIQNDPKTNLEQYINVWQLTIDAKAEIISVVYEVVVVAPNKEVASVKEISNYTRCNIPELVEIKDEDGKVISPKVEASLKFNELRDSQLGQTIAAMIQQTINLYPNLNQI